MEPTEIKLMYELEREHWWFAGKRLAISVLLEQTGLGPDARALDLGCGTGAILQMLSQRYQAIGVEFDPDCLAFTQSRGAPNLVRGSGAALPLKDACLDLAVASDLLYHRMVPLWPTLHELKRALKPGGWLLILDSAYQGLMGPHDKAMHGARRFTRSGLSRRLEHLGFSIGRATYRNTILFPAMAASRLLQRWCMSGSAPDSACRSDVAPPPPALNRVLNGLMRLEAAWMKRFNFAFGGTVCVLAQKK